MRRWLPWLVLFALACAPVQVTTRAEPGTDFTRFATYARDPTPHATAERIGLDAALDERLWREIVQELDAKGYREASLASADMVVSFHMSAAWRIVRKNAGDPDANYYVDRKVIDANVEIDFVDARRGALVWHGIGESEVSSPREAEDAALQAVTEILARFPVSEIGSRRAYRTRHRSMI